MAVHGLEHPVIAALNRQMEMVGAFFAFRHGFEELFRGVLGVAGHKADDKLSGNVVHHADKVGKVHSAVEVLAVAVHILAKESYVLVAGGYKLSGLGHYGLGTAGTLPTTDIGHDAVGAEVVAAVHNAYPCLHAPVTDSGLTLGDAAVSGSGCEHSLFADKIALQKLGEAPELVRAEAYGHNGVRVLHLVGHVLLLDHAAADADYLVGLGLFGVVQSAHIAQNAHFRVLTDGAGVDDDNIRLGLIGGEAAAHLTEIAPDTLGVAFVLLAAIGVHEGQHVFPPLRNKAVFELLADLQLAVYLFFFNFDSFVRHVVCSFNKKYLTRLPSGEAVERTRD